MKHYILGIESSCDDTSAAVAENRKILANVTANQQIHADYGGVVPELASRAHQSHIVPTVTAALAQANLDSQDLSGIAFTAGPGLLGSLLVGASFAKSMALALDLPLYPVHHMQAHFLAHLIEDQRQATPPFPFLCLTVSGGHTQIIKVHSPHAHQLLGQTIDDAAGEAFDKAAKIMGLPYPGGPLIDKLAQQGDPDRFSFSEPKIPGYDFSFSGLKTSFLYFLQKEVRQNDHFVEENQANLAASLQASIIRILLGKLEKAAQEHHIPHLALAGGVSANSGLRRALQDRAAQKGWQVYLPAFEYCTDNGAMIAISGYFQHLQGTAAPLDTPIEARRPL
ncbi:MAG: tRNA (adenosine(37)-N6)-threonylcarbamoyltransferase complex transferase subunit TsaD [Schleiferiaceae bacterium]|nr:tRNA (adenosine(37)-N6)-threonylcarbamoyltransferase complex transferase subunit TsaD [Schleiferiaceae bacterium]